MWTLSQVSQAVKNQTWTGLPPSVVEYLVVAGGGGGGLGYAGGGGAGGLLAGYVGIASGTSYTVTVGAAGTGATGTYASASAGGTGGNSVFSSITANGGGGGGSHNTNDAGVSGGSGGGNSQEARPAASGIAGQGNAGGVSTSILSASGGGGAGTVGRPNSGTGNSSPAGAGGAGIASAISGTVTVYAGGGGGCSYEGPAGAGGVGGGGAGGISSPSTAAGAGTTNTGGGGGGANSVGGTSKAGGSGVVIIRYPGTTQFFTGGTLSYANGYIIHTFYANGTLAPTVPTLYANPDYQISRSLRFNSADQTYLGRTPSVTSSTTTLTYSAWVKRGDVSTNSGHFGITAAATSGRDAIRFDSNSIQVYLNEGNGANVSTSAVFRDPSAWYHIVVAINTTQGSSTDRIKVYVNGVLQTLTGTYPVLNYQFTGYNVSTKEHNIGKSTQGNYYVLDGYLAEINFIDGQALTPSSFGWTNPATGVWAPLDFVGTYGTNGFNLTFSDNSNITAATLGADTSGNGNNWTPNNFSVSAGAGNDSLVDTPTSYGTDTGVGGEVRGNYSTWSPLANLGLTLTNGNLTNSYTTSSWTGTTGTMAMDSGTWYFEYTVSATASYTQIGVIGTGRPLPTGGLQLQNGTAYAWSYQTYGQLGNNSTYITSGITSATTSDIIMVAVDVSNGKIWFGKNGTWFNSGSPSTSANAAYTNLSGSMIPAIYSYGTESGDTNFGQRPFAYTAPSGFKALNTQNLPTPTIGATSTTLANKYFNTVLFFGKNASNFIPVGFAPDFAWTKSRNQANGFNMHDTIRGNSSLLYSDLANAASSYSNICAFGTEGVTLAATSDANAAADSSVAWFWRGGGTAVTNTSGSITSSVSASPTSGFSVVTYTGNGTAGATIGHGLGTVPEMILVKNRVTATSWRLYHVAIGNVDTIFLDTDAAIRSDINPWNSTTPTSTVITLGSSAGQNEDGSTFVGYCFAPVAGYSAFGSYTGNGNASGPFVHLGFRPAFLLIRSTGNLAGYHWFMFDNKRDPYNLTQNPLGAANATAEPISASGYRELDMLSNGFKIRASGDQINTSTQKYIYMAFAENPFKYSLAR